VNRDGNAALNMAKISTFWYRVAHFYSCYGFLYAYLPCVSVLHLRRFASLITELLLRDRASVIFGGSGKKNYALDQKMMGTFFNGLDVRRDH